MFIGSRNPMIEVMPQKKGHPIIKASMILTGVTLASIGAYVSCKAIKKHLEEECDHKDSSEKYNNYDFDHTKDCIKDKVEGIKDKVEDFKGKVEDFNESKKVKCDSDEKENNENDNSKTDDKKSKKDFE